MGGLLRELSPLPLLSTVAPVRDGAPDIADGIENYSVLSMRAFFTHVVSFVLPHILNMLLMNAKCLCVDTLPRDSSWRDARVWCVMHGSEPGFAFCVKRDIALVLNVLLPCYRNVSLLFGLYLHTR